MVSGPVIDAPVNPRRGEQNDTEGFVARDAARLIVESPAKDLADVFVHQISLHGLRGLVEDLAIADRTPEFDVFRMAPDQGASRAGGFSAEQFKRWNVGAVPDLLGQQAAVPDRAILHHG